jgi:cytochrome c-type biogenesis protein CcmE
MSRIDDELEQAVREADVARAGDRASAGEVSAGEVSAGEASAGRASAGRSAQARSSGGDEARPVVADAQERKGWGLLAVLLVLAGIVLTLVFSGGEEAVVYSYRVDEIKAKAAEFGDRQLRVQGTLVYGSLVKRDSPCEHRFMMRKLGEKTGEALEVRYPLCVVPDTFREVEGVDVEVTAEGRLDSAGYLQATKIFAKCPSKYEMRDNSNKMGGERPDHSVSAGQAPIGVSTGQGSIGPTAETSPGAR